MTWTEAFQLTQALASIATVVLVILAWQQIRVVGKQARTTFEDSLTRQYRKIMEDIPTDIWLGSELRALDEELQHRCRDAITDTSTFPMSRRFSTTKRGLRTKLGLSGATGSNTT
jgi:hypothetical protein